MRHIYFLLFFLPDLSLFAQIAPPCPFPDPPGAEDCLSTCVFCDFDGYQGLNNGFASSGNIVCGQIALNNDLWFGFAAGSDSISINIITSNCQGGDGLQAALFESCDAGDAIACNPGIAGGAGLPLVVSYGGFEPGQTYFLMLDGFSGDVCNFEIDVQHGTTAPPQPGPTGAVQGLGQVCPMAFTTYSVAPVSGAGYYHWTAPPGASINGGGNNVTLPAANGNVVQILFGQAGGQICVSAGNACYAPTTSCRNVTVQPLGPTFLPPVYAPWEDLPFIWDMDPSTTIGSPGVYQLQAVFQSWLGCDSIVRQKITLYPPLAGGRVFYDFDGNGVFDAGSDEPIEGATLAKSGIFPGQTTQTDSEGQYRFYVPNIQAGDTIWIQSLPFTASYAPDFHLYSGLVSFGHDFAVTPPADVSGFVFYDNNENGIYDTGDGPSVGVILASGSGQFATTDHNGQYHFALPGGAPDTIRALPPFPGATSEPPYLVHTDGAAAGFDFALSSTLGDEFDLATDLTNSNIFRAGFVTNLSLTAKNNFYSTTPAAQARVSLPYFVDYVGAIPMPDLITGDTLYWNLGALGPLETRTLQLKLRIAVGTPGSTPVNIPVLITPVNGDEIPANNAYLLQTTTFASADPNDKQVSPAYVTPAMLNAGSRLEYTIRFQNTGNYPADFVRVVDTLQALVDIASLRVLASSHACTWSLQGPGVLEFFFADINLPDSTSNEPESHGFVKFSVEALPGLEIGATAENFCDIYFDFNDPIRTNTAATQVVYFLPGGGLPPSDPEFSARPNPAGWWLQFSWADPLPADGLLRLFSVNGWPVAQQNVAAGSTGFMLDVSYVPNGIYLAVLESGGQVYHKRVAVLHEGDVRRD